MSVVEETSTQAPPPPSQPNNGHQVNEETIKSGDDNEDDDDDELQLPIFPEPDVDGEIASQDFLEAAAQVVGMLDYFGKLFIPVKYDMQGNVHKLTKKYNLNRKKHSTLQKMIMEERNKVENPVATDALMWLRRGLHMIELFFEQIVSDFRTGKSSEDLVACLRKSYELTLEPYHGYVAQQLFGLLSRKIPTRTQICRALTNGYDLDQETVMKSIHKFCVRLKTNVMILKEFYDKHDLNNNYKV